MQQFSAYFVVCICVNSVVQGIFVAPENGNDRTSRLEKHCKEDQDCVHGLCNSKSRLCQCFDGWTGFSCDTNELIVSDGKSGTGKKRSETTGISLESRIQEVIPIEEKHSLRKDKQLSESLQHVHTPEERNDELQSSYVKTKVKAESVKDDEHAHRVCGGYKRRNLKERMCLPGLICSFGTCSSTSHDDHISFECTCDPGAIGLFCEHKCCLECGDHGRCELLANGTEVCDCNHNYYGDKCEFSKAGQLSSSTHRKIPLMIIVGLSIVSALLLLAVLFLLLILRDRGCLALMAIPTKCKQNHETIDARGSVSSSVLVYYPGGDSLPTLASISPDMNHHPQSDLVQFSNIQSATQCTKETDYETYPCVKFLNEADNDNKTDECYHEDNNDYSTITCENEAGNNYSTITAKTETDDDNPESINKIDTNYSIINKTSNDYSTVTCINEATNDTPECANEADNSSTIPCKNETGNDSLYCATEMTKDYSMTLSKTEAGNGNPECAFEADNDYSMIAWKNEAGNDTSHCATKAVTDCSMVHCQNEASNDNQYCASKSVKNSSMVPCKTDTCNGNSESANECDNDSLEYANEAEHYNLRCANEADNDDLECVNEAYNDNLECADESDNDDLECVNEAYNENLEYADEAGNDNLGCANEADNEHTVT